ncbi:hypothetical protein D3C75_774120 [compost metagenome]
MGFVSVTLLLRTGAPVLRPAPVIKGVEVGFCRPSECLGHFGIEVHADLVHPPSAFVGGVIAVGHGWVVASILFTEITRLLRLGFIVTRDQADAIAVVVRGIEPFSGHRKFVSLGVIAVTAGFLVGEEVVLRPVAAFDAGGELSFPRVVAAIANSRLAVITPCTCEHIDIAGDIVKAIAGIAGTAYHLDTVQLHRKNHVHKRHIAVIAVAGNAIDQQLDRVNFAFTIKTAKGNFARGGALIEFGEHHPGSPTEQFPAVVDRHFFQHVRAKNIH